MSTTLMALGLYKSAQISLPLLKAGFKILRDNALSAGKESEWEKGVEDLLGDQVKELLKGRIANLSPKQLEAVEAPLVSFTGLVLQSLVQDVINTEDFASVKAEFTPALAELPQRWKTFVGQGIPEAQPLNNAAFLATLQAAHDGDDSSPAISPEWLASFFSQWIQRDIGLTRQREGWHTSLAAAVAPLIGEALSSTLVAEHPTAAVAFRESMLRFHTELCSMIHEIAQEQRNQGAVAGLRHHEIKEVLMELTAQQRISNKEERLAAYRHALLSAFRPYQELAIDNYAAAEQAAPDIWDIFVHPACSENHLRPEDMDVAQRESPPRLPVQDLLPLLARDDHRRTVLLADPGMGKSTLIQCLVAHLASERPFTGAAMLSGLLPIPLILRDLVPHLPENNVENWTWASLIEVFLNKYKRDEAAPLLCECFKDRLPEFRQHLGTEKAIFFLIDGLDEIGDLTKRRQIVECIQEGFRAVNHRAHWLITSRVIGYESAPIHHVDLLNGISSENLKPLREKAELLDPRIAGILSERADSWLGYIIEGYWSSRVETFAQCAASREVSFNFLANFEECLNFRVAQLLHLAPFDDKRQDLFTQRWFQHRHSTDNSRELMREVRNHHHDGVRIISRVPNLLCMMNILKRSGKPLPDGRAALYDEIVKAYLSGIDAAYRLRPVHGNTCPIEAPQRRFLLALLGAHMQQIRSAYMQETPEWEEIEEAETEREMAGGSFGSDGNILISRPELELLLSPAIQRMREEGQLHSTHTTNELLDELLHHIASRSGLLIPRSSDALGYTLYGFTHLSFLEFFAAEWLSFEYDRQRNRIVRRTLALEEGQTLSELELDREFPPHGPIQHPRESFRDLPTIPAWHEPLIFLLESRKADTPTLLRWLFPALHSYQPHIISNEVQNPTPILPLDAVQLAVNLAHDPEIPISPTTRQDWWRILWSAYLNWPVQPWGNERQPGWPIAPVLLRETIHREEMIMTLTESYAQLEKHGIKKRPNILQLQECSRLTCEDIIPLAALTSLKELRLNGCTGLKRLPDWASLQHLEVLDLRRCTGLKGPDALNGIVKLANLGVLDLDGCTELDYLPDMSALQRLQVLVLFACSGLHGRETLNNLTGLNSLKQLLLDGCSRLTIEDVEWLQRKMPPNCEISGP